MIFKKNDLYNLLWIAIFKFLIELVYIGTISKNFEMFSDNSNLSKYIISWALLIVSIIIVRITIIQAKNKTSILLLYLVYLFSYLPGISLWALNDLQNDFFIYFNIYWFLIFGLMLSYSMVKIPSITVKISRNTKSNFFILIFLFFAAYGIYYSYKFSGLRIHLNLLTVYNIRNTGSSASTLEGLLYYIVSTVVYPFYAMYFYKSKKWLGFSMAVFMELLMFSVAGHKLYFFIIPVGIVAFHFYNERLFDYIPKLLSLLVLGGIFEQIILKSYYIISYFVRRILYVPALLDSYYYDFFVEHPPTYFGQDKILSRMGVTSPYSEPVSRVIGDIYMNGSNASTGLFGDAFSNAGVHSVVLFPIAFLIAMVLIDFITNDFPKGYYMTVLVALVMVLLNGEMSGIFYNFIIPMSLLFLFVDYTPTEKEPSRRIQDS